MSFSRVSRSKPLPSRRQSMISWRETFSDRRIIAMFWDLRVSRMNILDGGPDFCLIVGDDELSCRGDFLLAATVPNIASMKSPSNLNHTQKGNI